MLLAAGFLLIYPSLYSRIPFFQTHFKDYHFFNRFLTEQPDTVLAVDSLLLDSLLLPDDSLAIAMDTLDTEASTQETETYEITEFTPGYQGLEHLASFFRTLLENEEQIRIGYFSDSSTEGDIITASFRDSLQRRFGGQGVGFVPIINPISGFRRTVIHSFSNNWYHCYIGKRNTKNFPRGLSGEYFTVIKPPDEPASPEEDARLDSLDQQVADSLLSESLDTTIETTDSTSNPSSTVATAEAIPPDNNFWVQYRGAKLFPGTKVFPTARLFYGKPVADSLGWAAPGHIFVRANDERGDYQLAAPATVNEQLLSTSPATRLRIDFAIPESLPVYGVSLESSTGVIVDNLPSRGNSGPALRQIPEEVLTEFHQLLDYDLLIFQFGLNVLNAKMKNYSWYEQNMVKMIRYFQAAMPDTPILIIGPSDRAIKLGGAMRTDPSVPLINEALRRAAERTRCAFFSFYEAMGGQGSMVEWVDQRRPRLANLDYTHFNFAGARVGAGYLLDYLLTGYEDWYAKGPL